MTQLQIEADKFYRTKAGEKVGPMLVWDKGPFFDVGYHDDRLWDEDGTEISHFDRGDNIVAEWAEPEHTEVDMRDIADQPEAVAPPPAYVAPVPLPASLTKREWFAGQITTPLLYAEMAEIAGADVSVLRANGWSAHTWWEQLPVAERYRIQAQTRVMQADALIAELDKETAR